MRQFLGVFLLSREVLIIKGSRFFFKYSRSFFKGSHIFIKGSRDLGGELFAVGPSKNWLKSGISLYKIHPLRMNWCV